VGHGEGIPNYRAELQRLRIGAATFGRQAASVLEGINPLILPSRLLATILAASSVVAAQNCAGFEEQGSVVCELAVSSANGVASVLIPAALDGVFLVLKSAGAETTSFVAQLWQQKSSC
jgi:hypothetical protein